MAKLTPLTSSKLNSELEQRMIKIKVEGYEEDKTFMIKVIDYVKAKGQDLREFGYTSLDNETVLNAVEKILNREEVTDVIGVFIQNDIVLDEVENEK